MRWSMRKIILFSISFFFVFSFSPLREAGAVAPMTDYCIVPPYVIQDVPPNIMFLVDNSGSMFDFAYACPSALTTAAGSTTNVIPVTKTTGFKPGMRIQLIHAGAVQTSQLWVSSVYTDSTGAGTLTMTQAVSFSKDDTVQDYGCADPVDLYDESSTSAVCGSLGTSPAKYLTMVNGAQAGVTLVNLDSNASFSEGQYVVFASANGPFIRYVTQIVGLGSGQIRIDSPVTVADNDKVYDATCYYYKNPFPERSFDPNRAYYGYFKDTYFYQYLSAGGKFDPTRPKSGNVKATNEWDGNFLNWLFMRRVDVLKRVLTGGKAIGGEGAGFDKLRTIKIDNAIRGVYKAVSNAENYVGCSTFTNPCTTSTTNMNLAFEFASTGSDPSSFTVYKDTHTSATGAPSWSSQGSFSGDIRVSVVPTPVEGVLQNVVGTKARAGLTFYKTNEGGFVQAAVGASTATTGLQATINQINLMVPSANTPVGEALWTVVGYFAQKTSMEGGPGPRYASGDFQISNNVDPFNYGTGGQPRFPNCSKNYVLLVTDGEPCSDGNLPATIQNYTTGRSIFSCTGSNCPATAGVSPETFTFPASTLPTCPAGNYVAGVEKVALYMHTNDLRADITNKNNLTLFTVFAFGRNSTLLKYASINGGFDDFDNSGKPDQQAKWDANGDGQPDTYYEADDGYELEQAMRNALSTMLQRASSGTAASVLASGEGSGANLVQAVFYPRRRFGNEIIGWTGSLQNLWYYVDPFFSRSTIREDTKDAAGNHDWVLNLINDYIVQLYFDTTRQETLARRWIDSNGDGVGETQAPTVKFEDVGNLWEVGTMLWGRDLTTQPRTLYTSIDGVNLLAGNFSLANAATLQPYLQATSLVEAQDIVNFTTGVGLTTVYDPNTGLVSIPGIDRNLDGIDDYRERTVNIEGVQSVWKLGDILNSTPKIASWVPLNNFDYVYNDSTYGPRVPGTTSQIPPGVDPTHYITSSAYRTRGMVFVGGNDGMLHAFKLGQLEFNWTGMNSFDKARLTNPDISTPLGWEMWSFIPKGALPYLRYMMDPDYCHVYSVDLTPFIFDASIGPPGSGDISSQVRTPSTATWRTILIGGMRYGGACRQTTGTCATKNCSQTITTSCTADNNCPSGETCVDSCVKTPMDVGGTSIGFSEYFALDITDTLLNPAAPPQLLWEFTDPQLGFATSGPAVVRIGDSPAQPGPGDGNGGKWFVVFGSGPTGPIVKTDWQFGGASDQNLRLFVLDLKTGAKLRTVDTGIPFAFSSSLINVTYDHQLKNYEDDAVYVGYVTREGTSPTFTWTNGGVGRLVTKESRNVNDWAWSLVAENIGPVTTSVTHLYSKNSKSTWLFFGTGRYFYELSGGNIDDAAGQRVLFGIKEPCVDPSTGNFDSTCTTKVTTGLPGPLTNVTSVANVPLDTTADSPAFRGWYLNLDLPGNYTYPEGSPLVNVTKGYRSERVITDPLASKYTGIVFFTTYKPYSDECGLGGKSFIWALKYNTGGSGASLLKGIALLQVSTGSIEQKDLSKAFTVSAENPDSKGDRRSGAIEGVPPTAQGLALIAPPPAAKRVIHFKER
jgi:type IV pilus assembly protein PilY1